VCALCPQEERNRYNMYVGSWGWSPLADSVINLSFFGNFANLQIPSLCLAHMSLSFLDFLPGNGASRCCTQ
jgi:hypothetical protein